MDPATLLGLVLAFGGVYVAMTLEGTALQAILLPGPMIIVFAGTIGAGLAGATVKDALYAFRRLPAAVTSRAPRQGETIPVIVKLADRARREGLLALEDVVRDIDDDFLKDGLMAAIDGTDPEDLRTLLEDRIETKRSREKNAAAFFTGLGGYAPTIGIIGTVVSLVHVLEQLDEPAKLGPLIAAAFVATLWGIMSANLIWLPLGGRMKRLTELECAQMSVTLEGLLALQSGANPRLVNQRLRSLVPPDEVVEEAA